MIYSRLEHNKHIVSYGYPIVGAGLETYGDAIKRKINKLRLP